MKKKIIIAIGTVCLVFLIGGIYIIVTMEFATSKLDHIIVLHQVEILREQLLLHVKKVESDLRLRDSPHASGIDTIVSNVRYMDSALDKCFQCHRSEDVLQWIKPSNNQDVVMKLNYIADEIEGYEKALSRFFTMRANRERTELEYSRALSSAQRLVTEVSTMIHVTSGKLSEKTKSSYRDISRIKIFLYALVILAPFVAAGLGFLFVREMTKPVKALLSATRKLKGGDLDYKIEGLRDEFGEVAASFNDMSDSLKRHMREIQESEHRYRTLFESAGDAILLVEAEGEEPGKIVDANPAAAQMHGYTLDEMLRLNLIDDLDAPDAAEQGLERLRRILNGERIQAEINHLKKDGTVFPVEISVGLLEYMGHKYVLAFDRDISYRKDMEREILQSKLDWEDTFNTITDMITLHDKDFNITRANKAAERVLGLPFLEVTRAKCHTYYHGKDAPPDDCPSCRSLETGKPATTEFFEPHLGKYLELRAMPRFDTHNQLVGLIHVARDITERKRTEEALQRAEQVKLVGELATGLAHEIKNPLAGIKASVEMLTKEVDLSQEDLAITLQAIDEIKRIESLLKSLLDFARPPKPNLTLVDLNDLLEKTVTLALKHPSFSSNNSSPIIASKDFDRDLPRALADPMQMRQVFLNLLINGIEAMSKGGTLSMQTRYDRKSNTIKISIADTGTGIEKEVLGKVFQPFFTTKKRGTGLGLAVTRRLVEQNGGYILVDSRFGKGTVFNIYLQLRDGNKEPTA